MRRWIVGLAALSLAGFAGGVAAKDRALGAGGGDPFREPAGRRVAFLTMQDREAFAEARIAGLHAGLRLTAEQEKLWPPVADAIRALAKQRREAAQAGRERFAAIRDGEATDLPGQIRFLADRQAASAEALRRLADAATPLHAGLDEAQKRRLAIMSRFLRPGAEMGGRERWRERRARRREMDEFTGFSREGGRR